MIEYKFNEGEILKEIQKYVDSTYEQHYATGKIQSTEFILDTAMVWDLLLVILSSMLKDTARRMVLTRKTY